MIFERHPVTTGFRHWRDRFEMIGLTKLKRAKEEDDGNWLRLGRIAGHRKRECKGEDDGLITAWLARLRSASHREWVSYTQDTRTLPLGCPSQCLAQRKSRHHRFSFGLLQRHGLLQPRTTSMIIIMKTMMTMPTCKRPPCWWWRNGKGTSLMSHSTDTFLPPHRF